MTQRFMAKMDFIWHRHLYQSR